MAHIADALAEEFAGKEEIIHRLKLENAHFHALMEKNEHLFKEIQRIQSGQAPTEDEIHETLEKQRLKILDEMAQMIATAEGAA